MNTSSVLHTERLTKRYNVREGIEHVTIDVPQGNWLGVLGASGSGKSTLLKVIAGVTREDSGQVFINGSEVTSMDTGARKAVLVWQEDSLFETMTVEENVFFAGNNRERTREELSNFGVAQNLWGRKVGELSGGQRQRVALARAMVTKPSVVLLDEPFKGQDLISRRALIRTFHKLKRKGQSAVLVSHDVDEVLSLSDYIVVLSEGKTVCNGRPEELLDRPPNLDAALLIGHNNVWPAILRNGMLKVEVDGKLLFEVKRPTHLSSDLHECKVVLPARYVFTGELTPPGMIDIPVTRLDHVEQHWNCATTVFSIADGREALFTNDPGLDPKRAKCCWFNPANIWAVEAGSLEPKIR